MNINPKIKEKLREFNITESVGLLYLLTIYHDIQLPDNFFPEVEMKQINLSRIVERDYDNGGGLSWNIPLYEGMATEDTRWEWVNTEFRPLFGAIRPDAIGNKSDCIKKMKRYFAENPEVRKEEILTAVKMYLQPFVARQQDPKFLQRADYFISKVVKGAGTSDSNSRLDIYIETVRNTKPSEDIIQNRHMKGLQS